MARPRAQDYEAKRTAIREAAAALFAEHGFDGASMSDLAERCATTKSGLYHYYASKEEVLNDILTEHLGKVVRVLREAVTTGSALTAAQRLELIVDRLLAAYASADHQHKVQLNELARLPEAQRAAIVAMQRDIVRVVADILAEINPNLTRGPKLLMPVTMSLFGMVNWHYMWFREGGALTRSDYAKLATRITLEGIRAL
jgi:TetR/AcrR family transcriptional regulator